MYLLAPSTEGVFPLKPKIGVVLWDRRLTVDEVKEASSAQDEIARKAGYIDPTTGQRRYKGFSSS